MVTRGGTVRIQIHSNFDMLDLVQIASDHIGQLAGLDEDSVHWISVAVRESVINAIKHGNQHDQSKMVHVDFRSTDQPDGELVISVCDEGEGFEPEEVADPLAPENMLKSSGRGIFLMRSFMDDVALRKRPEGGMEVRMTKRVGKADE